ncbi:MAG: YncE family protein [Streptosporangiaceae bacterium]
MRARAAVAGAAAGVIIGCVGCSSGPAHPQASHTRSTAPASLTRPDRALLSPGCCFSAAALWTDPGRALVAIVRVGAAPVGLMLVRNGSLVVVADSNRFGAHGANSHLRVVDAAAALAGKSAVVGLIPAGLFPREMALEPDGQRLLVTNFASGQLEAVSIPTIP